MKSYISRILMAVAALQMLFACQQSEFEEDTGVLNLSVLQDSSEDVISRAVSAPTEGQVFSLEISRKGKLVQKVDDHRTIMDGLTLKTGPYVITATCGEDVNAAFDAPYYKGEAEASVICEQMSEAEVVCALANTKLTLSFSEDFIADFSEYELTVTNSLGGSLKYSNLDNTITKEGFFRSGGNLTWTLRIKNNEGAEYSSLTDVYENVKPRQHYRLSFSIDKPTEEVGGGFITIKVDNSFNEKEFHAALDLDNNKAPVIATNEGFVPVEKMEIAAGDQSLKRFDISSATGLKSIAIRHSDETLHALGLPFIVELVGSQASADLSKIGIKAPAVNYGDLNATVDMTDFIAMLEMGVYKFDLYAYDVFNHMSSQTLDFSIVINADADIVNIHPWARFAVIDARWFAAQQPEGLTLMYRKTADPDWITCPVESMTVNPEKKEFQMEITGLEPSTEYVVKAVSATDLDTREVTFMTSGASQIYNFGFDDWWPDGKVWYPNAQGNSPYIWDSANKAGAQFIGSSTVPETATVVSGKAAKMVSKWAVIAFAAGNIYTGKFDKIAGKGAELNWGIPFTDSPVALRGHYKYVSQKINRTQAPYDNMNGKPDKCQIMVLLTDWDRPFHINTTAGQFVDYMNDPHIIASAKYESELTTDGYLEFCLPLEYRNHRTPTHVVIACCSSYLGDFFTGAENSTLYVDSFSFEYDIDSLTPDQKAKVNYR